MTRRRKIVFVILGGLAVFALVPVVLLVMLVVTSAGSDKGSPKMASEWAAELARYQTPDQAKQANSDIVVIRFESGEWAFGMAQNSHGLWKRGGGTVVVKDSNGKTRAFFGHVCCERVLGADWEKRSLESYYARTLSREGGFVEHQLP